MRQLKSRLSEYLRAVRQGATFLVTDRDQVVAELRPPVPRPAPREGPDQALDNLAAAGEVTRARLGKAGWSWHPRGLRLPPGTAGALLDDLRSDRGGGR